MNFTAKLNGPPPAPKYEQMLFTDCDTGDPTTDTPILLNVAVTDTWIAASFMPPDVIRVGVTVLGLGLGSYSGTVSVTIADAETCEIGTEYLIAVELEVVAFTQWTF